MPLIGNSDYSPAYGFSMRDAHRKPAQPIRAPALSWHLAFRKDSHFNFESQWLDRIELLILEVYHEIESKKPRLDTGDKDRNERNPTYISNLNGVDRYAERHQDGWSLKDIELLRHTYDLTDKIISRKKPILPEGSRYETAVIESVWNGHQVHLRFEVFEEYFTLTSTISLRRQAGTTSSNGICDSYDEMIDRLGSNPPSQFSTAGGRNAKLKSIIADDVQNLYGKAWSQFTSEILTRAFTDHSSDHRPAFDKSDLRELRSQKFAQEIFADFRGILVCLEARENWKTFRRTRPESDFDRGMTRATRINLGVNCFKGAEGVQFAETLLPILLAADKHQPRASFENAEYTFSSFDHGRCLYGSSFGPQPSGDSTPLHYLLVAAHDDHRQLGTIANRLHLMGTLRLAALIDFERIISRHATLSNLDAELGHVQSVDTGAKLAVRLKAILEEMRRSVRELRNEFGEADALRLFSTAECERYADAFRKYEVVIRDIHLKLGPAALDMDLVEKALRGRQPKLKGLMNEVQSLRSSLRDAIDPANTGTNVSPHDRLEYRKIISSCGVINRNVRLLLKSQDADSYGRELLSQVKHSLASMDESIKFGIDYRAERSRYSQERFASLAKAMEIDWIPGFQKYDVFVRQRLERSYSLISAIESRFNFIKTHVGRLEERYRSIESANRNIEIKQLQLVGEIATICFLLPYYLSELLIGTIKSFGQELVDSSILKPLSWGLCVLAYILYLAVLHFRKNRKWTVLAHKSGSPTSSDDRPDSPEAA